MGDFNSRIGKASNPNENIGHYGEVTKNKNGAEMLMFLKNIEMKTLNDRVKKPGPERTRQCIQKGESFILEFMVVENGSSKEIEVHLCAADVGTTDHCLIRTVKQTRVIQNRRGRKLYRWRVDKLLILKKNRGKIKTARVPTRNEKECSVIFRDVGKHRYNKERYRKGQCRGEDYRRMGTIGQDHSE